jgi:tRNA threonylcarbamoyladenosine biosynthesis protein TsaE
MNPLVEEIISHSVAETEAIAAQLAGTLRGGECIALQGDLGAGKTQFVRGLVRALGGSAGAVSSPTYVLLHVYEGARLTVYHLDAYRVAGSEDFESIGFSELLEQGGVVIVEWAKRVASLLPPSTIWIDIEPIGESERRLEIRRSGIAAE